MSKKIFYYGVGESFGVAVTVGLGIAVSFGVVVGLTTAFTFGVADGVEVGVDSAGVGV